MANDIVGRYEKLAETVHLRLQETHRIVARLDVKGISPIALNVINHFGYLCAIISGWFFFSFYNNASNQEHASANSIYTGFITFFKSTGTIGGVGAILGLLGLTTLVSMGTERLKWFFVKTQDERFSKIIKKGQSDAGSVSKYTLEGELSQVDSLPLKINISSNTWFEFWMELLPVLFIALVVTLVISLNYKPEEPNAHKQASVSFIVEIIGFLMAVVSGAAFYFFLVLKGAKITRETEETKNEIDGQTWFARNRDLVKLILLLSGVDLLALAGVLFIRLAGHHVIPSQLFTQILAFSEFIVFMNLAGLCIGFATYCKGLLNNVGWLEYKLDATHAKLRFFFHQSLSTFFTNDFGKTYKLLFEDLLNLLELRLTAGRKFIEGQIDAQPKPTGSPTVPTATEKNKWQLSEDDKLYYPELVAEFESYDKERQEIANYIESLKTEAESKNKQIDNWAYEIKWINRILPQQIRAYQDMSYKERVFIKDGFDLGIWYRENEVGPRDGYYQH